MNYTHPLMDVLVVLLFVGAIPYVTRRTASAFRDGQYGMAALAAGLHLFFGVVLVFVMIRDRGNIPIAVALLCRLLYEASAAKETRRRAPVKSGATLT